jgi:hypothetical protein
MAVIIVAARRPCPLSLSFYTYTHTHTHTQKLVFYLSVCTHTLSIEFFRLETKIVPFFLKRKEEAKQFHFQYLYWMKCYYFCLFFSGSI